MNHIRTSLPDAAALQQRLRSVLDSDLPNYLKTTYAKRAELRSTGRFLIALAFFSVAVIIALYLTWALYDTLAGRLVMGMTLLWLTTFIITGRLWFSNERLLTREMNMALTPILTNTIDRMLLYTHNEENEEEAKVILERARLYDLADTKVRSADLYQVYGTPAVLVRDLRIDLNGTRLQNLAGLPPLFAGVLVEVPLSLPHPAETYLVIPDAKRTETVDQYWQARTAHGGVTEIQKPGSLAEVPLQIASSDPAAAQSILTEPVCTEIANWWRVTQGSVRGSIHGTKLYLMVANVSIKADASVSTKPAVVERLAGRVIQPIWRTLRIAELVTNK
ncbi:MAG: hypothetical protein ACOC4E_03080 [Patescibacteria group bacterium]